MAELSSGERAVPRAERVLARLLPAIAAVSATVAARRDLAPLFRAPVRPATSDDERAA